MEGLLLKSFLIQLSFSIPGDWSSKATASKPYSAGKYTGGTEFSPETGGKGFPWITEETQGNDCKPYPGVGWNIQKTNGTSSPEPESPRRSEKSSKFFRYEVGSSSN